MKLSVALFSLIPGASAFGNLRPDLSACPTLDSALDSSYGVISDITDTSIIENICAEGDGLGANGM